MRRPATSRFSSALSASISRQISSCTWRLAQRCHSSASRSSCTRGASFARASSRRACISWRSRFEGRGARSSSAVRISRSARSPAFSVSCSAEASVSICRQNCCSRRRLSCSARLRACWYSVSFCSSAAIARSRRSAAAALADACSRSTSASRRRPRHRTTTSSTVCSDAASCSSSVASVSRRAAAASASRRRRSRSSKALEASWNRRVSEAAYSDGIGGRPSHFTRSSAIASAAPGPVSSSISITMASRSACSRASARCRSCSAAASRRRSSMASRTASLADSNLRPSAASISASACSSAQASRTRASATAASSGSAMATSASAWCSRSSARARSAALISAGASCGAGWAASSCWRSFVRARRAATLLRPRWAMAASSDESSIRSRADTAESVCSAFSATLRISSWSVRRASARRRVCPSGAWRLIEPSDFASSMRSTTAARTPALGFSRATMTTSLWRPSMRSWRTTSEARSASLVSAARPARPRTASTRTSSSGSVRATSPRTSTSDSLATAARLTRESASSRTSDSSASDSSGPRS